MQGISLNRIMTFDILWIMVHNVCQGGSEWQNTNRGSCAQPRTTWLRTVRLPLALSAASSEKSIRSRLISLWVYGCRSLSSISGSRNGRPSSLETAAGSCWPCCIMPRFRLWRSSLSTIRSVIKNISLRESCLHGR